MPATPPARNEDIGAHLKKSTDSANAALGGSTRGISAKRAQYSSFMTRFLLLFSSRPRRLGGGDVRPPDESRKEALRLGVDGSVCLEFRGATISSDTGLLVYLALLTNMSGQWLDPRWSPATACGNDSNIDRMLLRGMVN